MPGHNAGRPAGAIASYIDTSVVMMLSSIRSISDFARIYFLLGLYGVFDMP